MSEPKRILLFETSALLGALSLFTDRFTNTPDALERLLQPVKPGDAPLIDAIKIPDHVLYELTGLLPISIPTMLKKFKEAKDARDEQQLNEAIELYALASPRGEVRDPQGDQKNHIRVLLRFIANHPDSLVHTKISQAFCQRLKADFSVLSSSKPEVLKQYRPTFADAFEYLGGEFHATDLRVHIGQLLMMGLISEQEFNERLGEDEKPLGHKKRFYKTAELLDKMVRRTEREGASITHDLYNHIKEEEGLSPDKRKDRVKYHYLTMGTFMRYPPLLRMGLKRYNSPTPSGITKDFIPEEELVKAAFSPSHLMMEHYLYSGIIPNDNESLLAIAVAMHFDISDFTKTSDSDRLRSYLDAQGFYENRPTMHDLTIVADALKKVNHEAPLLEKLLKALPKAEKSLQQRFNTACQNPQDGGIANHSELRIPHIGLPYEKVFSDALVNGALSWDEFMKLVQATDGLHQSFGDKYKGTRQGDVLLQPSANPDEARILVSQEGFVSRAGKTPMNEYISNAAKPILLDGSERHYIELSARALLSRCQSGLSDRSMATRLYRVFESMLYRPTTLNAADLRNQAITILGEDKVVQLEKDFANRHARKSLAVQPPYRSMFAAFHTNARIGRKNLGEVATAEAASTLLTEFPQADIWLANHDSDLFPHNKTRDVTLEESVVRQHGSWFPAVRDLNEQMSGEQRLHFLNTNQLLHSMHRLTGRIPRQNYETVKAKPFIMKYKSNSWERLVNEPIEQSTQRR